MKLYPSPSETPINTGDSKEEMMSEEFLRDSFFKNTDSGKMPTYGTIVPCKGHICAL